MQHERDSIAPAMTISSNIKGRIEFPGPLTSSIVRTTGKTMILILFSFKLSQIAN